jgi:hypothetical protein
MLRSEHEDAPEIQSRNPVDFLASLEWGRSNKASFVTSWDVITWYGSIQHSKNAGIMLYWDIVSTNFPEVVHAKEQSFSMEARGAIAQKV